jgi:predicted flap endonuclease-1-like 5' DNA nuclease
MGKVGTYKIRRANLRGKKPPGVPRVKIAGKNTNLAFLINDPDFPLMPQQGQKLPPGVKRRVPLARSRKEVLARLKAITALSRRDFGAGGLAASLLDGAIDATIYDDTTGQTPAQKRARQQRIQAQQQNASANTSETGDSGNDPTAQPRTLDSALDRLANMDFSAIGRIGSVAGKYLPEAGVIAGGDIVAENIHDRQTDAKTRRRRRLLRPGGAIQSTPGMGTAPGDQTTMSAVHDTLLEFDGDGARDRARKRAGELGAASVGGATGAYAGLATHRPGRPVQPGEDLRGKRVYVRRKSPLPSDHVGIGGEEGVVHRSGGRDSFREVKGGSFRKIGKGPLRTEDIRNGKSPEENARAASRAKGASAGRYSIARNNCEHGADRIVGGRGVSRQVRRAIGGAAIGAIGAGTVASILNRKNRGNQ